jgi:hypothetical protein
MAEISPLRRRMIDDMMIRNLSPATQQSYLYAVAKFSRHFGRSPDRHPAGRLPQAPPLRLPRQRTPFERTLLLPATSNLAVADARAHRNIPCPVTLCPAFSGSAFYPDRAHGRYGPSAPTSLGLPPGSTPIGRAGQRGFVQSGFNDVPHRAAPASCLAGPR